LANRNSKLERERVHGERREEKKEKIIKTIEKEKGGRAKRNVEVKVKINLEAGEITKKWKEFRRRKKPSSS
jgi:hypothetical protein